MFQFYQPPPPPPYPKTLHMQPPPPPYPKSVFVPMPPPIIDKPVNTVKAVETMTVNADQTVETEKTVETVETVKTVAALVAGFTQSRKTWKVIEIIGNRIKPNDNALVLFISQANNTASVSQIVNRVHEDATMKSLFGDYIYSVNDIICFNKDSNPNAFIAGFWHARTKAKMLDAIKALQPKSLIVVYDEADQAGVGGMRDRLMFLDVIYKEAASRKIETFPIFVTATVANLSRSAQWLINNNTFQQPQIIKILSEKVCEHHYAPPADSYVGPSYFRDNMTWVPLVFPKKQRTISSLRYTNDSDSEEDDDYEVTNTTVNNINYKKEKDVAVCQQIHQHIPEDKRKLTLVVVSHRCLEHDSLMTGLLSGSTYNVVVQLNSKASKNQRDYNVSFINQETGNVDIWHIPSHKIETAIQRGDLDKFVYMGQHLSSGIDPTNPMPFPYLLQASLFMGTQYQQSIRDTVEDADWVKLLAIATKIMPKRPHGYPVKPRVAIVSGNMIGRGITIQHPKAGFICTSFVFAHAPDNSQRGAANSQKVGRACGMLQDFFGGASSNNKQGKPIMLATAKVFKDALANEGVLGDKANHDIINLSEWINEEDWKTSKRNAAKSLALATSDEKPKKINVRKKPMLKSDVKLTRILDAPNAPHDKVTEFSKLSFAEFQSTYRVTIPTNSPLKLKKMLQCTDMYASVTYNQNNANVVANLCNYYKHPDWMANEYHIVVDEGEETVAVHKRNIDILNGDLKHGRILAAHNEYGKMCYYSRV